MRRVVCAKIGGDAADTSCESDCGAAGGAVVADGLWVRDRGAGVHHGVLSRTAHSRSQDEHVQARIERRVAVQAGLRIADAGLWIELPAAAFPVEREREGTHAQAGASEFFGSTDFGVRRLLPSSV